MFAPYCPRHQSRVLLGYESVVGVEQTPSGAIVLLRCHCGELVTHGSARPVAAPVAEPVVELAAVRATGSDESRCRACV